MLFFPNCKINLGLNVVEKRTDGFHNIETVFYPVLWRDALEVIEGKNEFEMIASGRKIEGKLEDNIIYKAWQLIKEKRKLPGLEVYLHKNIPMGAGLGGGSSDAAFFLKLINAKFELKLSSDELKEMASQLGSDCAFFIDNSPVLGTGKGDVFEKISVDLNKYHILVVHPGIHSNTREAYEGIVPIKPQRSVKEILLSEPVSNWKNTLSNDFEKSIFRKYPEVEKLKKELYERGAIYASMSGSGSAVFGLFDKTPEANFPQHYLWYLQSPES